MKHLAASEPDVLIVGGGSAGAVLTARLSEDPNRTVLLLEAGPDLRRIEDLPEELRAASAGGGGAMTPGATVRDKKFLWTYDVELMRARQSRARQIRGRVLGGSSSVNGSKFMRGIPEDYDSWGSALWGFAAVLPYFRQLETDLDFRNEFHGSDGPIKVWRQSRESFSAFHASFYDAALQHGVPEKPDLNDPAGGGIGPEPRSDFGGVRMTTALAYLAPVRARRNLTVTSDATVRRIVFEGRRAIGVEVVIRGQPLVVRAKEIILSAGVFGSPQLLLASGIGPAKQLRSLGIDVIHDLPGVGENLRCQPAVDVQARSAPDAVGAGRGAQLWLVYSSHDGHERNDMTLLPLQVAHRPFIRCAVRLTASSGTVRLRSADASAPPSINYGYLAAPDMRRLAEGVSIALDLFARSALEHWVESRPADTFSEDWIVANLRTSFHACGTCKLGPAADPAAVVDDHCRVHGLDALRVVDVSIVPSSLRAGPHATALMIGERAADLLTRDD